MSDRFVHDRLVHRGKVAEVHQVGVRMGNGRVVERDFFHYNGAAVILPVLADGSIALIRNDRFAVQERLLELPAGMIEPGEDPLEAARRELIEETGFTPGKLVKLGAFYTGPGCTDENMHAFLATELTDGPQHLEVYEQIVVETVADADVRRMIADGTIHDGKTIATLALYWMREKPA